MFISIKMGNGDIISSMNIGDRYLTVFPLVVESFMETYDIMIYVFIPDSCGNRSVDPSPMINDWVFQGSMETSICESMSFKRCILRIGNAVD